MALPKIISLFWRTFGLLSGLVLAANAATFPLSIPQRPTSFPLSRPQVVGLALTSGKSPRVGIAISRVNVVMEVVIGLKYQLETSNDLIHFSAVGAPFVADASTITQEFSVTEVGRYFRTQEIP